MDKRCKDCKYKVYIENDINEVWGFCSCMDKELRDVTNKYHIESQLRELTEAVNKLKEILGE